MTDPYADNTERALRSGKDWRKPVPLSAADAAPLLAPSYTIQFTDVGRDKRSWTEPLKHFDETEIIRLIKAHKALVSRVIGIGYTGTHSGNIYVGGFRKVGSFTVKENKSGK